MGAYVLLPHGSHAPTPPCTRLATLRAAGTGFSLCFFWNAWASKSSKSGDFSDVLLSMAGFAAVSLVCMPLCMYRQATKAASDKKKK